MDYEKINEQLGIDLAVENWYFDEDHQNLSVEQEQQLEKIYDDY